VPKLSRVQHCAIPTMLLSLPVLVTACGADDPKLNEPTSLTPVKIVSVNVEGPNRLAPGESAQFTATVNLSNFTTKTPASVRWVASPPSFLRVDASGVATGGPLSGGAAVTADVIAPDGTVFRRSIGVTVVPQNTFVMLGTVTDAEFAALPVRRARIELTTGSLFTETDDAGFYRLFGVPINPEVRVTAPGYQPVTESIQITGDFRHDFRLALSGPRLSLSGDYTLTVEITGACGNSPPLQQSLRLRQYDAVITQTGLGLQVVLTEPRFLVVGGAGNRFGGSVSATSATFDLIWHDGSYPSIVERLADGTFLVSQGTATAAGSAAGVSGTLAGSIFHYAAGFPGTLNLLGVCDSPRFSLTPR
jgi:hypothetical protein